MNNFWLGYLTFWIFFLLLLIPFFFIYRFYFFFRDPKRKIPSGNNIVSPADGKIIYIKEIKDNEVPLSVKKNKKIYLDELIKSKVKYDLLIGIFMTPVSVHYNRFPFSGYIKNKYYTNKNNNKNMLRSLLNIIFNLKPLEEDAEYILENERNTILLSNDRIDAGIIQIADKWIKKIENIDFKIGDFVNKGDKIGFIRMGSQCDLFLKIKSKYKIRVKERNYVKAGSSVLIDI
ncbi:MAG: phosphatidylserine decarboxylase, partial [Spirochaetes bacterium]|nr:phosphatidylserine decarboxylase [Spirochaetota bacterium]